MGAVGHFKGFVAVVVVAVVAAFYVACVSSNRVGGIEGMTDEELAVRIAEFEKAVEQCDDGGERVYSCEGVMLTLAVWYETQADREYAKAPENSIPDYSKALIMYDKIAIEYPDTYEKAEVSSRLEQLGKKRNGFAIQRDDVSADRGRSRGRSGR
jgi:hypothetical protein